MIACILQTKDILTTKDKGRLNAYILQQLLALSYTISNQTAGVFHLQSSVKQRVYGNQLYGNIKLVDNDHELQILITPYPGKTYNEAKDYRELLEYLF